MQRFLLTVDKLSTFVGHLFSFLIVALTLQISWEVFSRYALDDPHAWAFDVMIMLYGTLFMMAGAYTLAKNGHVRGDVLYGFFEPRTQATIDLMLYIVFFIPGVFALTYAGYYYAAESWAIREHSNVTAEGPADLSVQDDHPDRRRVPAAAGHRRDHPLHHLPQAGLLAVARGGRRGSRRRQAEADGGDRGRRAQGVRYRACGEGSAAMKMRKELWFGFATTQPAGDRADAPVAGRPRRAAPPARASDDRRRGRPERPGAPGREVRGEARPDPSARACDRRAELLGLLHGTDGGSFRTLDHAVARTVVHLATSLGIDVEPPRALSPSRAGAGGRHHLTVELDRTGELGPWSWANAAACDRRAFLRGALLGSGPSPSRHRVRTSRSCSAPRPPPGSSRPARGARGSRVAGRATGTPRRLPEGPRGDRAALLRLVERTAGSSSWRRTASAARCRHG